MRNPLLRKPLRVSALCGSLLGLVLGGGCDRKWDFECSAAWSDNKGVELWSEVYTYPQMDTEQAATAKCKAAMLEARPKRGKQALCKCVGKE